VMVTLSRRELFLSIMNCEIPLKDTQWDTLGASHFMVLISTHPSCAIYCDWESFNLDEYLNLLFWGKSVISLDGVHYRVHFGEQLHPVIKLEQK
jgi:hypothetical protein